MEREGRHRFRLCGIKRPGVGVAIGILILTAVVASRGWMWAVIAWFGSSLVTFAVATAMANRRALAGEDRERGLVREQVLDED
jgi:4-hydroxybenzoate polyprenyltransferase